ncbi:MAG: transcription elongation factor GreA [Candidatus Harrisonbacteria bacterium RIFCSPLOWO2_01_FULL_40_28]|uniref:Transcription elongation factor GreA n=2 Tax=Candidatus Harrisoniibacteriota TaxID=1817905 RepID=A0A1G1ZXM2_9BACT|nr:MAG: transcription elongation factor GreA [Candidatus Harrisonbacteria bacterium RIFCSPLOWO2_01_FULL_40_28]OGY68510.1 MAG: transcription elongation factor GreA [Candidatus Harrisonbacteria bacterium RIFOXYD1_FULL_40_9]
MESYLTREKLDELNKELDYLKGPKRFEIAERLKRAKELGDLSENSEYQEAREEQNHVETKIMELESLVKQAVIIQKSNNNDAVNVGGTVHVKKDGKAYKFTIVGSNESRPESGLISNASPLGRAFLGHKVGDVVVAETPSGKMKYEILKIE